jgi:hypothetical protein
MGATKENEAMIWKDHRPIISLANARVRLLPPMAPTLSFPADPWWTRALSL